VTDDPTPGNPQNARFLGLTLTEAEELARADGLQVRILGEDDKRYIETRDLREDRINLYLEAGLVVKVTQH